MHGIKVTNQKFRFTQLIAREMNLICVKRFVFKRCADIDRATQYRAALMINVRADGADAIRGKDLFTQARIASRI